MYGSRSRVAALRGSIVRRLAAEAVDCVSIVHVASNGPSEERFEAIYGTRADSLQQECDMTYW